MTQQNQDPNPEIGRLFAELGEIYGRASEGVDAPPPHPSRCMCEESAKRR